jgi:TRAP-type C4-dicarboxylate transport system permease large subunit
LASSLLRYAEALLWLPYVLRSVNISVLHQFATDLLIAMTLLGATQAARAAMSRPLAISGLIFSLLLLWASVWEAYHSISLQTEIRMASWFIPLSAYLMMAGFLRQVISVPVSSNKYFPVNMADGGIKTALLLGAAAMLFAAFTRGAQAKVLAQYFFDAVDQYTLMCIPFLVLSGVLLNPQRRSGNLVPFALLALWVAAVAGIAPGKFIFALMIPGAMVFIALWLSGAKNMVCDQYKPVQQLVLYGAVGALFVGSFIQAFVSFTEGAGLATALICVSSVWIFHRVDSKELAHIFSYSAVQSAGWLFTGAATMLWVRLLGDASLNDMAWLADVAGKIHLLRIEPGLILLGLSIPVGAASYFIGPIAAILISSSLLLPQAASLGLDPMQTGVILLMSVALVKVIQTNRAGAQMAYAHFKRNHALLLMLLVVVLVAFMPKLSLRLPLLMFGPGL